MWRGFGGVIDIMRESDVYTASEPRNTMYDFDPWLTERVSRHFGQHVTVKTRIYHNYVFFQAETDGYVITRTGKRGTDILYEVIDAVIGICPNMAPKIPEIDRALDECENGVANRICKEVPLL